MATIRVSWPVPADLFTWLGENSLARDSQGQITAVLAKAVEEAYLEWYRFQSDASGKIDQLRLEVQSLMADKANAAAFKVKNRQLEKELRAARSGTVEMSELQDQLLSAQEELLRVQQAAAEWEKRCDRLFDINNKLGDTGSGGAPQTLVVQKIKPHEPKRFDGSQDLEVVTQFLDDVEHYVRQGGAICPKATKDNQYIDTLWRFLTTKIFRWFEPTMQKRGVDSIPPKEYDYGVTWASVKTLFKSQFVPESAISVIRKEWHMLKFNRMHVLKFNRRALELVVILGGSLTITREDPLWEEYLQKLPEATANDVTQQARLMHRLKEVSLTLSDMMDIVAERTLPFLPTSGSNSTNDHISAPIIQATAGTTHHDPMDLTNVEEQVNAIDGSNQGCYSCGGVGHFARQCPNRNINDRAANFRNRQQSNEKIHGGYQRYESTQRQPTQRQPTQRQFNQRKPTQRNELATQRYESNQQNRRHETNWRMPAKRNPGGKGTEDQQVYTVNDPETKSGAYFEGEWAEEGDWDEDRSRQEDLGDGGISDCERYGGTVKDGGMVGKDRQ
jgi:hypothetical protein